MLDIIIQIENLSKIFDEPKPQFIKQDMEKSEK